ncbi:hypothetical protein EMN47_10810 [Prolixibacteraceae bacterium JC049]|nr:hypothetical protein [Prolixibacteraceae bacterium JC049]
MKSISLYKSKGFAILATVLLSLLFLNMTVDQEKKAFNFSYDEHSFDAYAINNQSGKLESYRSLVNIPVCSDSLCYDVSIWFYWDPLGNFKEYKLVPKKPLTKADHIPFKPADYEKLTRLLNNDEPTFFGYTKKQLFEPTKDTIVDAVSGATLQALKDELVEGAAFTCYTLWQVTHGEVKKRCWSYSAKHLTPALSDWFFKQDSQEAYQFLIDELNEKEILNTLPRFNPIWELKGSFLGKRLLNRMSKKAFRKFKYQKHLANHFNQMDYFTQIALLKRIKGIKLHSPMVLALKNTDYTSSSRRDQLIKELLAKNSN